MSSFHLMVVPVILVVPSPKNMKVFVSFGSSKYGFSLKFWILEFRKYIHKLVISNKTLLDYISVLYWTKKKISIRLYNKHEIRRIENIICTQSAKQEWMKRLTNVIEYPDFTSLKSSTSRESKYLKIYAINNRKEICEIAQEFISSVKRIEC